MPELPEVETVVCDLQQSGVIGQTISDIQIFWAKTVLLEERISGESLRGSIINHISRRGKWIVFHLSCQRYFVVHLRMSGKIRWVEASSARDKHEHVVISFNKCAFQMRFHDPRKFGRWIVAKNVSLYHQSLGPEPLSEDFKWKEFYQKIKSSKRAIKTLLLDQSLVAGVGNIYADEALFEAGILPHHSGFSLKQAETKKLHHAVQTVIARGITNRGSSLGQSKTNFSSIQGYLGSNQNFLQVYGREGYPCIRCQQPIIRAVINQRSSHFCPHCQK